MGLQDFYTLVWRKEDHSINIFPEYYLPGERGLLTIVSFTQLTNWPMPQKYCIPILCDIYSDFLSLSTDLFNSSPRGHSFLEHRKGLLRGWRVSIPHSPTWVIITTKPKSSCRKKGLHTSRFFSESLWLVLELKESSLSAGVWVGAQQIPGSLGKLWICVFLEVQVGDYIFLCQALRLYFAMPADAVCGPADWQPGAGGCGSRWERHMPKASGWRHELGWWEWAPRARQIWLEEPPEAHSF